MTKEAFDRAVANAKANAGFRAQLRSNFSQALAGQDLTPQEIANLQAMNIGAEPTVPGKNAGKGDQPPPGGETIDPAARKAFDAKVRTDPKTGKLVDKVTGREVKRPGGTDGPGGTLGGHPTP